MLTHVPTGAPLALEPAKPAGAPSAFRLNPIPPAPASADRLRSRSRSASPSGGRSRSRSPSPVEEADVEEIGTEAQVSLARSACASLRFKSATDDATPSGFHGVCVLLAALFADGPRVLLAPRTDAIIATLVSGASVLESVTDLTLAASRARSFMRGTEGPTPVFTPLGPKSMGMFTTGDFTGPLSLEVQLFLWVALSFDEADTWRNIAITDHPGAVWLNLDHVGESFTAAAAVVPAFCAAVSLALTTVSSMGTTAFDTPAPALAREGSWWAVLPPVPTKGVVNAAWVTMATPAHHFSDNMPGFVLCEICMSSVPASAFHDHVQFKCSGSPVLVQQLAMFDEEECFTVVHFGQKDLTVALDELRAAIDEVPNELVPHEAVEHLCRELKALSINNLSASKKNKVPIALDVEMTHSARKAQQGTSYHSVHTPSARRARARFSAMIDASYKQDGEPLVFTLAPVLQHALDLLHVLKSFYLSLDTLHSASVCSDDDMLDVLNAIEKATANTRVSSTTISLAGNIGVGKSTLLQFLVSLGILLPAPKDDEAAYDMSQLGDSVGVAKLENLKAFIAELEIFLDAKALFDAQASNAPTVERMQEITFTLQLKVIEAHIMPTLGEATVSERSPLCNLAFGLELFATGYLSKVQMLHLVALFEEKGYMPGLVIFMDDTPDVCLARAKARAAADPARAKEADTPLQYFKLLTAAHRAIFALPSVRQRVLIQRVRLPALGSTEYSTLVNSLLAPLLRQQLNVP